MYRDVDLAPLSPIAVHGGVYQQRLMVMTVYVVHLMRDTHVDHGDERTL